ncbi:DALR anticodon-binding domain-containing protein [Shigella flexneri]
MKLADLQDEALERARRLVAERTRICQLTSWKNWLTRWYSCGGICGFLQKPHRRTTSSTGTRLAFEGNTAPYMQYAYTRVLSVFRKAEINEKQLAASGIIREDREAQLAARLLQFEETLTVVAREGTPHVMCAYLYDLAGLFSGFYGTARS